MKLNYPKEWFERSARIEGDSAVGAGALPVMESRAPVESEVLDTRIAFGQFIELWRRNRGWNAEQLAAAAGVGIEEVLELERDPHAEPEVNAVYRIAGVMAVPPIRLMQLAGLVESRDESLCREAIRFAARSESMEKLTEAERAALEAFVSTLMERGE